MPALNLPYLWAAIVIDRALTFEMGRLAGAQGARRRVQRLMTRVQVKHDPAQDAFPRKESARVTLRRRDGRTESVFVEHVERYPSHPMTRADVETKARESMAPVLGQPRAGALIELLGRIDTLSDASVFASAMLAG